MVDGKIVMRTAVMLVATLLATSGADARVTVTPTTLKAGAALPVHIGGRVERIADGYRRQWPGTYFETAVRGTGALMKIGGGDVRLRVSIDTVPATTLVKPKPGLYRIAGLTDAHHMIRVDVVSESQAAPTVFGGFYAPSGTRVRGAPVRARSRQIEFIGDSHTVGYGNVAGKRDCTEREVWATTDTPQGLPGAMARRYDADYQVNAISGRGIVRNYDGMPGDTVPVAYPFTLFDKAHRYRDSAWHPNLYVIALGTNDFTTPLHPNEPWKTRAALHADYEQHYVAFVERLHAQNPGAHFLLWATDLADGEIAAEVGKVAARLKMQGVRNLAFVTVTGLAFSGCHAHPSTTDDAAIADAFAPYIRAHPDIWSQNN